MKWGALSEFFVGVAWKRLSAHEVDPATSNGHEFQGVEPLKELLGTEGRREFNTTYLILNDNEQIDATASTGSWYDSREGQPHRTPEWRLYYPKAVGQIQARMRAGDLLVIALMKRGDLVILLAPRDSMREAQLRILFGLTAMELEPLQSRKFDSETAIGFAATEILEELGLASPKSESLGDGAIVIAMAEELSKRYPTSLPRGAQVSGLVHARIPNVDPIGDPDGTLVRWIEAEEALFRRWEDGLIERRLRVGFWAPPELPDVQAFRDFSMSIRQSRVSRAGGALQLHTARLLSLSGIRFEAQATTENGERPDFLFPGEHDYHDDKFDPARLRMLAVKFTAKDRWRQVLNEAERIPRKHLLTLEAAVSKMQLGAMRASKLQLVVPQPYIDLYPSAEKASLMSLTGFLAELALLGHSEFANRALSTSTPTD